MPEMTSTDRALTPLLTLITQESLDEDYEHVARQRATAGGSAGGPRRAHWVAAAVVGVFGVLVTVAAVQTSQGSGVASANRESLLRQIDQRRSQATELQSQIVRLRETNVGLQDRFDRASEQDQATASRAETVAAQAGFGPVSGPGVVIKVDDAPNGEAVRDEDLARLVNGLWEAGAEAIAINGKRLTARSSIRNSGAAINLNGPPPLSPPYVVAAIGDTRTLQANLLDTSTGLAFDNIADALGFPVTTKVDDHLTLPAAPQRQLRLRSAVAATAEQSQKRDPEPPGKEATP